MTSLIRDIDRVWIRNSFVLDYWSFGRSDIDITISVPRLNIPLGTKIARFHKMTSSLLGVIGELCIVSEEKNVLTNLSRCINSLELLRDPELCLIIPPPQPTLNEKIVFLHKFIMANWLHDQQNGIRQKKLDYVFNFLNINSSVKDFPRLKTELGILIQSPFNSIIEKIYDDIINEKSIDHYACPPAYHALLFNKRYTFDYDQKLVTKEIEILFLVIKWEIWGAYTNRFFSNFYNFNEHVGRLLFRSKHHLSTKQYFELVSLAISFDLI